MGNTELMKELRSIMSSKDPVEEMMAALLMARVIVEDAHDIAVLPHLKFELARLIGRIDAAIDLAKEEKGT